MFEDTYKTIQATSEGLYKEKGSKFLAYAYPISKEDEVKAILEIIKKEFKGAAHHCYAYVIGADKATYRINDDGEPSGTAGKPIYGQINSFDLTNILVIVVRYFGGTLLGVSGLIRSYKTAAKEALTKATIIEKTINDVYCIAFEYAATNSVMKCLNEKQAKIISQDFKEKCAITFSVRKSLSSCLYDNLSLINTTKTKFIKSE